MNVDLETEILNRREVKGEKENLRYTAMIIIMLLIFGGIIARLINLQVINVNMYREYASTGSHTMISYSAPRGRIYDRNDEVLATNKLGYTLTFTETKESNKKFFDTMKEVFEILEKNGEKTTEGFQLKVDPIRFEFGVSDDYKIWSELRFKKDRGFDYEVLHKDFSGKKMVDLNQSEISYIDEKLKEMSPEYIYRSLIKKYELYNMIRDDYSKEEWNSLTNKNKLVDELIDKVDGSVIRKYMIIKDSIYMNRFNGNKPSVIAKDLKPETSYIFEQIQSEMPGISIQKQPIRYYPYNEVASNIMGYVGKIGEHNKERYEERGYDISDDYIGITGLESVFEDVLRGRRGEESIKVNLDGRKVKTLGERPATPGNSIKLTIDYKLQRTAERALDETMKYMRDLGKFTSRGTEDDVDKSNATRGAAVVLNVNTGEILALASRPGIDLNLHTFPGRLDNETYKEIFMPDIEKFGLEYIYKHELYKQEKFNGITLQGKPMWEKIKIIMDEMYPKDNNGYRSDDKDTRPNPAYNYATQSLIPPGSTFKILSAIAGLEEGVITPEEKIYDAGQYKKRYKDFTGASWMYNVHKSSHGYQNIVEAIRDSNNYYFYEVADRLFEKKGPGSKESLDALAEYAWKFGLGANMEDENRDLETGIEISEKFGPVYYYDFGKRENSRDYTRKVYELLNKGESSIWVGEYKPIDIIPNINNDSEEVYKIKKELTSCIKAQMVSEEKFDITDIGLKVRELIENKEEYQNEYSEKDIEGIIKTITASLFDARSENKSGVNLYNASIGQGKSQFTPLQLANYVATLVNGGYRREVYLVKEILDEDGNIIEDCSKNKKIINETGISKETIDIVKEGMLQVTSSIYGTAYTPFKGLPIKNGAKTGSATFQNNQEEFGRTSYATFIGFAPYDNPEIAVSVVVFDGGHGGYSARVARAIYEEYFKDEILKINPEYEFMLEETEK
ncbi:penicillin-binding transpeptidase domain-containing protein [Oceanirhabdus sp. W0125-5]|uniref:penicillin-binding transpeptidase domain-containing protein n=1 Tax=Oceanirhabdus sp. W0125-5 TaxID=2999116 RepID=UPI0022F2AA33|nr:penicillin-binding transpeptidase domain-containing protein [Oceanirhabdus sp. W0125-5]WBW95863.1 penicillin-binding transpeptidase domain-containing protein [Oceanirhabdus sp. W0125-5]